MNAFAIQDVQHATDIRTCPTASPLFPLHSVDAPNRPISFQLKCLGGVWEGIAILESPGRMKARLSGLPPVRSHQHVLLSTSEAPLGYHGNRWAGIIRDVRVLQASSPDQNQTEFWLDVRRSTGDIPAEGRGQQEIPWQHWHGGIFGEVLPPTDPAACSYHLPGLPSGMYPDLGLHHSPVPPTSWADPHVRRIHSYPMTILKNNGQRIRAICDDPIQAAPSVRPTVVMAPGYGETKRDYLALAYYFAANGFRVLRYDHTNHVGESDGQHYHVSLSSMKEDFQTMVRFVGLQWPGSAVIGLASSLGVRAALRAESDRPALDLLVLLVGIVNVRATVTAVHQEDVFTNYVKGCQPETTNILGFNVGRHFLADACREHFVSLEDTLQDVQHLQTSVMMVSAGNDAWVDGQDLVRFAKALGPRLGNWIVAPEALHRLQENPLIAKETYRQVVAYCLEHQCAPLPSRRIQEPSRWELGRQNRKEKLRQSLGISTEVGASFWEDYLTHFQSIGICRDYVALLDHMFHALGPIGHGQRVLDVGCGNGNAGMWIRHQFRNRISRSDEAIQYIGIDVVGDALKRAKGHLRALVPGRSPLSSEADSPVRQAWAQVDIRNPLPFADNQFDYVMSNLVLGYVSDPRATLRELYRVLAPGGRMVISNLKPDADFSGIYQRLVRQAQNPDQLAEARELLNNYGKIRQAEKEGVFHFYDRRQWESIVEGLGVTANIYSTFGNQAFLIVLEKPPVVHRIVRQKAMTSRGALKEVQPVVLKKAA